MVQFYFLSIVLNALAGYILITGDNGGSLEFTSRFSLNDETARLLVGILSILTGFMKLLSPFEGSVPVAGDLVPALTGFLTGLILIFEYYRSRSTLEVAEPIGRIDRILLANKKFVGTAALIAALLHFLFPRVPLL